jgi:DNA modification methylase
VGLAREAVLLTPFYQDHRLEIYCGDALAVLKSLPDSSAQCCVTSPPYWGLRDYGVEGQLGLEKTPDEYVEAMRQVFSEVRRVLKKDGTLWLNLGDSYAGSGKGGTPESSGHQKQRTNRGTVTFFDKSKRYDSKRWGGGNNPHGGKIKPKDLIGIPWRVAFALQADGWYLRSDIIWAKSNCMPESVTDRPTRSHEYVFLLSKSQRYFYDSEAIKEPCIYDVDGTGTAARKARSQEGQKSYPTGERNGMRSGGYKNSVNFEGKNKGNDKQRGHSRRHDGFNDRWDAMEKEEQCTGMRNKRDVWTIAPATYPQAHFATYPPDLIKPCILAGSKAGDVVLDPFGGSGTTGEVSLELGRNSVLIELNPDYIPLIEKRTMQYGLQLK